jgi:MFS family permease
VSALTSLGPDGRMLFATRFVRLFAYGGLSVVLVFYLVGLGLSESDTGFLLTATLLGDTLVSLYLTTRADRIGRRRMLMIGAALMAAAGVAFAFTRQMWLLVVAGTIGVISPSGQEVGPFLSIEQAALSHVVPDRERTHVFAWYTLAGSIATALGALAAGFLTHELQKTMAPVDSYRAVVIAYAGIGVVLWLMFRAASGAIDAPQDARAAAPASLVARFSGLHQSHAVVLRLSALFALDSFGGGFVVQSFAAYWFYLRYGVDPRTLGTLFFAANVLAGFSALAASRLASRIGLVNTMVVTHLPSNVLLILIPLMPTLRLASPMLLLRFSIRQMDVPTRQSYTMAVVTPSDRAAASGVTGVARTTGAAISPLIAGMLFAHPSLVNVPFFVAGSLNIVYDVLLLRAFRSVRQPDGGSVI